MVLIIDMQEVFITQALKVVTGIRLQISPGVEFCYEIRDRKHNEF